MTEKDIYKKTSSISRLWRKALFRISIYFIFALCIFLFFLPIGTKYYLEQWLLENGATEAVVQKMHINIFMGMASLQGINVRQEGRTVLSNSNIHFNLGLQALLRKEALLQKASLEGISFDIERYENGNLRIGSYTIGTNAEEPGQETASHKDTIPWIFRALKFDLSNIAIHYKQPDLEMELIIEKGYLEKFNTDPNDKHGTLALAGTFNGAPFSLDLNTLRVAPHVIINGSVSISELQLKDFSELLQDVVDPIVGTLTTNGTIHFEMVPDKKITVEVEEGGFDLVGLDLTRPPFKLQNTDISWKGNALYSTVGQQVNVDGSLILSDLLLKSLEEEKDLTAGGETISWEGEVTVSEDKEGAQQISLEGTLHADELNVVLSEQKMQINQKQLAIEPKLIINTGKELEINGSGNIQAEGFKLVEQGKEKPLVTLGAIQILDINWSGDEGLLCDKVDIDSLYAEFAREIEPDRQLVSKTEANEDKKETTKNETANIPPIRIKNISFSGDNGFAFTDNTLTTKFKTELAIKSLQVSDIDSTQPDKPFIYQLEGIFDELAPLKINGSALLFADKISVEHKTELRNYSLQYVSPYVVDAIGTTFDSGQFNLTSSLTIKDDTLDSKNHIVLKNVNARAVNEELQQKLNNQLPVPLSMALSMLQDKKGEINLDIPVDGPLSELNIGIADVLITATSKAIFVGVTPYLAYTVLGPTGALVYLGLKAGEALLNADLPELKYENGVTELSAKQKETLLNVGKAIEKDSEQDYTICAKIFFWELAGDTERTLENQQKIFNDETKRKQLRTLGEKRSNVVKEYLLSNFDIDQEKLLICDPGLNMEEDGIGVVYFLK